MNIREIERLWKQATNNPHHDFNWFDPAVVKFAELVAAAAIKDAPDYKMGYVDGVVAEREACVQDIQMHIPRSGRDTTEYQRAMRMIERIRARGQ